MTAVSLVRKPDTNVIRPRSDEHPQNEAVPDQVNPANGT